MFCLVRRWTGFRRRRGGFLNRGVPRWGGFRNRNRRGQDNNVSRPGSAAGGAVNTVRGDMRSYEEDLDYALEPGVRGPERRPLVGTDNYGQVYSEGPGTHQPYHTRYDSKPFSYIRSDIKLI